VGEAVQGLLVSVVLVYVGYISDVVVESAFVSNCRELGLCKFGIVCWSAGDECVGGRSSLVTGRRRMGGEGEGKRRGRMRRGRMSCWKVEQWILAQEKEG
jgi:hypothetical protein